MPAEMRITQDGLSLVGSDKSRSDGFIDGSLVTITNMVPGTVNTLQFRSLPSTDDEASASLSDVNEDGTEWTFSPKPGVFGTYALRLTVDGVVSDREFSIRSPGRRLRVPALNSKSNPAASLLTLEGDAEVLAAYVAQSVNNEYIDGHPYFDEGNFAGWWPDMELLFEEVEYAGRELIHWDGGSLIAELRHSNHTVMMDSVATCEVTLPGTDEQAFRLGTKIRLCRFNTGVARFVASETSANTVTIVQRLSYESEVNFRYGVIEAVLVKSVLVGDVEDVWWVSGDLKPSA